MAEWARRRGEDYWDWSDRLYSHRKNGDIREEERREAAEPPPPPPPARPKLTLQEARRLRDLHRHRGGS